MGRIPLSLSAMLQLQSFVLCVHLLHFSAFNALDSLYSRWILNMGLRISRPGFIFEYVRTCIACSMFSFFTHVLPSCAFQNSTARDWWSLLLVHALVHALALLLH